MLLLLRIQKPDFCQKSGFSGILYNRSPKPNIPAKELYHDPVKQALIKEGWTITADPYTVEYEEFKVFAYLAAECSLAVERGSQKIAVEITTFLRPSSVRELENALGQ